MATKVPASQNNLLTNDKNRLSNNDVEFEIYDIGINHEIETRYINHIVYTIKLPDFYSERILKLIDAYDNRQKVMNQI